MPNLNPRWGNQKRKQKAEAILNTLKVAKGDHLQLNGTWLDFGCGSGEIIACIAPSVGNAVGIDPEPWGQWKELCTRVNNINFIVGSYTDDVAIKSNSIDVIICNQVYEHVPDPKCMLDFIHEKLKTGGICYFAGPNLIFPIEPHIFWPILHWLPRNFSVGFLNAIGSKKILDANSVSYFTLIKWFDESGFVVHNSILDRLVVSYPCFANVGKVLPSKLIELLSFFSPGFIFILEKK